MLKTLFQNKIRPEEFTSPEDLELIKNKQFSKRQIDVLACIISGRNSKKIASMLSLSPKTVESHIYNIMQKLNCSSRGNIIDYIEKTKDYALLKKHYFSLQSHQGAEDHSYEEKEGETFSLQNLNIYRNEKIVKLNEKVTNFVRMGIKKRTIVAALTTIVCISLGLFYSWENNKQNFLTLSVNTTTANTSKSTSKNFTSTIRWNIPRQDHHFIGRVQAFTELQKQLNSHLDTKQHSGTANNEINSLAISACAGLGGIGKTQLALQYANHSQHPYNLIAWLPAENIEALKHKILELSQFLRLSNEGTTEKEAIILVKQWLQENPGWLLIYDNVNNYQEIESFLPEQGGNVILTTRHRVWPSKFKVLELDVMSEEDAILLLKSQIHYHLKDEETNIMKEIVKSLGYLPLAIAQAGAYINQSHMSLFDYLTLYNKSEYKILANTFLPEGTNTGPIATTWNITLQQLAKDAKDKNEPVYSLNLLLVSAYLSPEKISRDLLLAWFKETYPNVSEPEFVFSNALAELWKYSLINIDNDNNSTISVHRLVQAILRQQHQFHEVNTFYPSFNSEWFEILFHTVHQEFQKISKKTSEVVKRQHNLFPHLQALLNHYEKKLPKSKNLESLVSDFLCDLGRIYDRLSLAKTALDHFESALTIKQRLFGVDHRNTIFTLLRLGMAYKTLGDDLNSKIILERVLKLQNQYEQNQHSDQNCLAMSTLGIAYRNLGDYSKAKEIQAFAAKVQEARYGKDNPQIARTLLCLCETLGFVGEPLAQIRLAEKILKFFEENNDDSYHIGTVYYCLGMGHQRLGNLQQAKLDFEKSLMIRERFFGRKHLFIAFTLNELGNVYYELGKMKEAKAFLEEALKLKIEYRGDEHYETAKTLINLGKLYNKLGDTSQSKIFLERSYKIYLRHFGLEHPEVAKLQKELL